MIKGDLQKWVDINGCNNLLLFSQLVREQLFDFSIPSNRVATLNSNYLCKDALCTIKDIEEKGVPQNSLTPIVEELYDSIVTDPVFNVFEQSPQLYFLKTNSGHSRKTAKVSELNYEEKVNAVRAIGNIYFEKGRYYTALKNEIVLIISNNDLERQRDLYRLVKSLLTELLNLGFSQQYIYYIMDKLFWNPFTDVETPDKIKDFFEFFSLEKKEYDVVLVVDKKAIKPVLQYFISAEVTDILESRGDGKSEKSFLNSKDKGLGYLVIQEKAIDPFRASQNVKERIEWAVSMYKLQDHYYTYRIDQVKCGIYQDDSFFYEPSYVNAAKKISTPSKDMMQENIVVLFKALLNTDGKTNRSLLTAANYHSHALESHFEGNQLLDFWAIFESVIDISNRHAQDRIEQVCSVLVPILKQKYIYSLFKQLNYDLREYSEEWHKKLIGESSSEQEIVKSICYFTLLDEYQGMRELFTSECKDFPLLAERIEYYNSCLKDAKGINEFVEKHGRKVRWQIMRIYRNRNLIIHNGEHMPYLSLLIENLHSYVDTFLDYCIRSSSEGVSLSTMSQKLYVDECEWVNTFANKKDMVSKELIDKMLCL